VPNARGKFSSAVAPDIARATPTMVLPTLPTKRTSSLASSPSSSSRVPSSTFSAASTQSSNAWSVVITVKSAAAKPAATKPAVTKLAVIKPAATKPTVTKSAAPKPAAKQYTSRAGAAGPPQKAVASIPQKMNSPAVMGMTFKPSNGFTVVTKKQKKVKAPSAEQVVIVAKKPVSVEPATKPLSHIRGVQIAKSPTPKQETYLVPQTMKTPTPTNNSDFPGIARSTEIIPELSTKSLVKLQKLPSKTVKTETPIRAPVVLDLTKPTVRPSGISVKASMKSQSIPTTTIKTKKTPVHAPSAPVAASTIPEDSASSFTTPKMSTKNAKKSAKATKKSTKAEVVIVAAKKQLAELVPGTPDSGANTSNTDCSALQVSVSEPSSASEAPDMPSLPKHAEIMTAADITIFNTAAVVVVFNKAAVPADSKALGSIFTVSDIREADEETSFSDYIIKLPATCTGDIYSSNGTSLPSTLAILETPAAVETPAAIDIH
jgi:hypothetical protein